MSTVTGFISRGLWLCGKQIKRSLRTGDKALARRRLAKIREKGIRLHGGEQAGIHIEELAKHWLASIKSEVKASTYTRRTVCLNQTTPFFKGMPVRPVSLREIVGGKCR